MQDNQKSWKIIDILKSATDYFSKKKIENPRLNAEQLLAYVLNLSRVQLYVQFEKILSAAEISQYRALVRRRAGNEPLQYILGKTEFMGLTFKVSPAALIPRPETELLVENIIETVNNFNMKNPSLIDVGTGSGCIAISLAHFIPDSKIIATDVSMPALKIARQNSIDNKVDNVNYILHNILETDKLPVKSIDIIVSNPPYVSKKEMIDLPGEIKDFEPEIALTDYDSGLLFYEKILSLIEKDLKCKFVFMEMNTNLKEQILTLASNFNFKLIDVLYDLNNLPRILKIEI